MFRKLQLILGYIVLLLPFIALTLLSFHAMVIIVCGAVLGVI